MFVVGLVVLVCWLLVCVVVYCVCWFAGCAFGCYCVWGVLCSCLLACEFVCWIYCDFLIGLLAVSVCIAGFAWCWDLVFCLGV